MTSPPPPSGPPAGWYPDPEGESEYRWWDGSAWSPETTTALGLGIDSTSPAPEESLNVGPAAPPTGGHLGYTPAGEQKSPLSDVGQWMGESFRMAIGRAGNFLPMIVAFVLPPLLLQSSALFYGLRDTVIRVDSTGANPPEIEYGGATGMLVLAVALIPISSLLTSAMRAAVARQSWAVEIGKPEPWSKSVADVFRRWPRVLGAGLIRGSLLWLPLVFLGLVAVSPLLILLLPLVAVLAVFLWLRLAFVEHAAALAPSGTGMVSSSWNASKRQSFGLFGRLVLATLLMVNTVVVASLVGSILAEIFGLGGQGAATPLGAEVIRFNDTLGSNLWTLLLGSTFSALGIGAGTVLATAATTLLYRDLEGPVDDADIGLEPEPSSATVSGWQNQ